MRGLTHETIGPILLFVGLVFLLKGMFSKLEEVQAKTGFGESEVRLFFLIIGALALLAGIIDVSKQMNHSH